MFDRIRWSAIGAAVAVTFAGGLALPSAKATNTNGGGAGVVFVPVVPCRLFDTRPTPDNVGPRTSPLGATDVYTQQVTGTNGNCTIPAAATAVALNVTTTNATVASYLTLWPADAPRPLASNLNWVPGSPPTPNKVDVKLSTDGRVSLYNNAGNVDVLADIVGYYADHNHDDRYYTKAEVDAAIAAAAPPVDGVEQVVFGLWDIEDVTSGKKFTGSSFGCAYEPDVDGIIPLPIPVGSRLVSVDAALLDLTGVNLFDVSVGKTTTGTTSNTPSGVAVASGGTQNNVLTHVVLAPSTPEIADANESFNFTMHIEGSSAAFCNAVLTYDTSP